MSSKGRVMALTAALARSVRQVRDACATARSGAQPVPVTATNANSWHPTRCVSDTENAS